MKTLCFLVSLFFLALCWAIFFLRLPFCILSNVLLALGAFAMDTGLSVLRATDPKGTK